MDLFVWACRQAGRTLGILYEQRHIVRTKAKDLKSDLWTA